jgi:E3 ubiquitin-protein ligase BRE1
VFVFLFKAQNKMRSFQEMIRDLEKNLETRKQEEAALLNEIEVTGQAFEDMQEQNSRLLSQLREKDDAHIKLMVERVKLQQSHKVMSDEKAILLQQAAVFQEQIDAQVSRSSACVDVRISSIFR